MKNLKSIRNGIAFAVSFIVVILCCSSLLQAQTMPFTLGLGGTPVIRDHQMQQTYERLTHHLIANAVKVEEAIVLAPMPTPSVGGPGASCFTITVATDQTPQCGCTGSYPNQSDVLTCNTGGCTTGSNCDHCATFTFTNTSSHCNITQIKIEAPGGICWSMCSDAGPATGWADCEYQTPNINYFQGNFYPGGGPGGSSSASITICYDGGGGTPQTFYLWESQGAKWPNPCNCNDDCCIGSHSSNYYTMTF